MKDIVSRNLSVHQEHEFLQKMEDAGLTSELAQMVIESKENKMAKGIIGYVRREIEKKNRILDYNANPFIPKGWKVESHAKNVDADLSNKVIELYLAPAQKSEPLGGRDLARHLQSLTDKILLNANVLDYYLRPENKKSIPKGWIGQFVCFWGTRYVDDMGCRRVRYLCSDRSDREDWTWGSIMIEDDYCFDDRTYTAVVSK